MAKNKASATTETSPEDTAEGPGADAPEAPDDAAVGARSDADRSGEPGPEEETRVQDDGGREAELEAEIATLKDQLLRAVAETDNVRRRAQRDREEAIKYGAAALLRDIVGVADNLERALESIPKDAAESDERIKALLTGVEMIEREFHGVLERHKVERMEPHGEAFDPHFHEAMFELPDPSKPSGTVVQVVQPGYRLHDRLLRPARVGIAKGGPAKPEPAGDGAAAETEPTAAGTSEPGSTIDTEA